ncbi:MAG: dihydroneopterin aldolase [Ardenticatenaceae bacterium]|nr:dihydroneopterin aldolase [Ardenticatenaceae bacterium]HBY93851.1 dihydroneopterin aldolase [Chloroflexota bacterium]
MSDKIVITGLQFHMPIGVSAAEREVGQRLRVDMEVSLDLSRAGASDVLEDTVSYAELVDTVLAVAAEMQPRLVEHLAERLAEAILARFPVEQVWLRLLKTPPPLPAAIEAAGVEIVRNA